MNIGRTSLYQHDLNTPCGQLNSLWRKTMQPMSTALLPRLLDEPLSNLHETIDELKRRADRQHATTGIYPEGEVLKFLVKFS